MKQAIGIPTNLHIVILGARIDEHAIWRDFGDKVWGANMVLGETAA